MSTLLCALSLFSTFWCESCWLLCKVATTTTRTTTTLTIGLLMVMVVSLLVMGKVTQTCRYWYRTGSNVMGEEKRTCTCCQPAETRFPIWRLWRRTFRLVTNRWVSLAGSVRHDIAHHWRTGSIAPSWQKSSRSKFEKDLLQPALAFQGQLAAECLYSVHNSNDSTRTENVSRRFPSPSSKNSKKGIRCMLPLCLCAKRWRP